MPNLKIQLTAHPLPGELYQGHLGRLRILNQKDRSEQLIRELRVAHPNAATDPAPLLVSRMIDMQASNYLPSHSLLPYSNLIIPSVLLQRIDRCELWEMAAFQAEQLLRQSAYYCPQCVAADLARRRYSYWRRVDQLPGVSWCTEHLCQLVRDPRGVKAFASPPGHLTTGHLDFSQDEFDEIQTNPVLRRFHEISEAFLTRELRLTDSSARVCLAIAKERCIPRTPGLRQEMVSEIARDCLPRSWLERNLPKILVERARRRCHLFASLNELIRSTTHMALVLALVFDSAEEAINHWQGFTTTDIGSIEVQADLAEAFA